MNPSEPETTGERFHAPLDEFRAQAGEPPVDERDLLHAPMPYDYCIPFAKANLGAASIDGRPLPEHGPYLREQLGEFVIGGPTPADHPVPAATPEGDERRRLERSGLAGDGLGPEVFAPIQPPHAKRRPVGGMRSIVPTAVFGNVTLEFHDPFLRATYALGRLASAALHARIACDALRALLEDVDLYIGARLMVERQLAHARHARRAANRDLLHALRPRWKRKLINGRWRTRR